MHLSIDALAKLSHSPVASNFAVFAHGDVCDRVAAISSFAGGEPGAFMWEGGRYFCNAWKVLFCLYWSLLFCRTNFVKPLRNCDGIESTVC